MTQEFDRAFRTEAISLKDVVGIFVDNDDPSAQGRDEPVGSILLRTNGTLYQKIDTGDFDWIVVNNEDTDQFQRTEVDSSTYQIVSTDSFIGVQYTGTGPVTLTLPDSANVVPGYLVTIKDEAGKSKINNITVQRSGSDVIDGHTDFTIASNNAGVQVRWTGFQWSLV